LGARPAQLWDLKSRLNFVVSRRPTEIACLAGVLQRIVRSRAIHGCRSAVEDLDEVVYEGCAAFPLLDAGCPAVMPLVAPIGSVLGVRNAANVRIMPAASRRDDHRGCRVIR